MKDRKSLIGEVEEGMDLGARLDAYVESDEFKALIAKEEAKAARAEERRRARQAVRDAALEERRRNPKSVIDAYHNHMETCPHPWGSKEQRAWRQANPLVWQGVTYVEHWWFDRSNSGKSKNWYGYLTGSDGSRHEIVERGPVNRRNDPARNWGLGRE